MLSRLKAKVMLPLLVALAMTGGALAQSPNPAPVTTAQGQFVANKKAGKPFHKLDCPSAKKLKPANMQYFATRDDAIKAGHTPCKICKP